jgi:hypothetical protein
MLLIHFGWPARPRNIAAGLRHYLNEKSEARRLREEAAARDIQRARQQRALDLEIAEHGDLEPVDPGSAILRRGEQAFASAYAELLEEKTVGYRGKSAGISVRVAKGVTIRTGGNRGTLQRETVVVAEGPLLFTNQRVIFNGDKKSFAAPLTSVTSFEMMSNGVRLSLSNKTVDLLLGEGHRIDVFKVSARRLVREACAA